MERSATAHHRQINGCRTYSKGLTFLHFLGIFQALTTTTSSINGE
jgi:hypothetical protein